MKADASVLAALNELGEFFGAGLIEEPGAAPVIRYSRAYRRWLENQEPCAYDGGVLYPHGPKAWTGATAMAPEYSYTYQWDEDAYQRKTANARNSEREGLEELRRVHESQEALLQRIVTPHTVGGGGYTHAIVNYGRALREGLDRYEDRIQHGHMHAANQEQRAYYEAMTDLLKGVRAWHGHCLDALVNHGPSDASAARLRDALRQVPFQPARNFYEAIVAYNLIYYLDGCDNPGRLDMELGPFYERDAGTSRDEALILMRAFYDNVRVNGGWSAALGGSQADGSAAYTEFTGVCLEASHRKYRPSLELRVRGDMPDDMWDLAMDALASGCGQPAFYNERGYYNALRAADLGLDDADLALWNGGGCTETMLHGCSNVGSLDAGFNLPLILVCALKRTLGQEGVTFADVLQAFKDDARAAIHDALGKLNIYFAARAQWRPQPVRSLLMDDCIARGLDFNAGGARYNWSVVNVAGVANVADSLEALREVVFTEGVVSPADLLKILEVDYAGAGPLRLRLLRAAKFGNDIESVDELAADVAGFVYSEIMDYPCCRGGRFLPSHIMFETFADAGKAVGATPDGRRAGEPLADCAGPMQGRDTHGPTALFRSLAKLPQHQIVGTPVLNLRVFKPMFGASAMRANLRSLIEAYFEMGGLQVQVSVLDREELEDALIHPETHGDLIVRIGGYSTHFNWLSDELKREVIRRTEYAL